MNITFNENAGDSIRFLDLIPWDFRFEDLNIDERVLNTLDKASEQFKSSKPSSWLNIDKSEDKVCSNLSPIKVDSIFFEYQDEAVDDHNLLFNDRSTEKNNDGNKDRAKTMCYRSSKNMSQAENQITQLTKNISKRSSDSGEETQAVQKSIQQGTETKSSRLLSNQGDTSIQIVDANSQSKRRSGYSRWGQKEDCLLFKNLTQLWKESDINIEDYWDKDIFLSDQHLHILESIADKLKWKREPSMLLKRVQTLGRDQSISVRQKHLLRKLYYQTVRQKQVFTIEGISDMFPGKLISTLELAFEKIKANLRHMYE